MKKPFLETKIGSLFKTKVGKGVLNFVDGHLGGVISDTLEINETPSGKVNKSKSFYRIFGVISLVLIILVSTGKLTMDQAIQFIKAIF